MPNHLNLTAAIWKLASKWARSILPVLVTIILLFNTVVVSAGPVLAPLGQVSDITILPRNYVFTWGSSGQNIDANNEVYCSANPDFWQVLYWRTSDTNGSAGVNDWNPNIATAGDYDIYVYMPSYTHSASITTQARYYFNGGLLATVDQNQNLCTWVYLGRRWFDAGTGSTISMPAQTSDNPYRLISADGLRLVYIQPPPSTFSVSGRVVDSGGAAIGGVTLSLNTGATTTTAANGTYQFTGLLAGGYTITPGGGGYSFSPSSRSITLSGNQTGLNFTITNRYAISGRLADTAGNPIAGVTVHAYGLTTHLTTTSAADGRYTFGNLVAGVYQIAPDRGTFPFSPTTRGWMFVPPNSTGQDFTTTPVYGNVSGRVTDSGSGGAVGGARVSIAGKVVQADGNGNYTISTILPGSHPVYITAANYEDYRGSVAIQAGVTSTYNAGIKFIRPVGYRLPFPGGVSRHLTNIWHPSGYAEDWGMPVGSDVVAARGGKVKFVKETSNVGGKTPSYIGTENYITIEHDDKLLTWYVHLQKDGAFVKIGDPVKSGQVIGKSGMTGYTTFPHLHFALTKNNYPTWTRLLPSFLDVPGGLPAKGGWYTSDNYLINAAPRAVESSPMAADTTAPAGGVRFELGGGEAPDLVKLFAFDYGSDTLQVRMANTEGELAAAAWQPLQPEVTWLSPSVSAQFRDQAGNISAPYSDVIEAITYEPLQAGFSMDAQVCTGQQVTIENLSAPLCEQCGWSWSMGNGVEFSTMYPGWPEPGDGFAYSNPGVYTVTLQASNATATSSFSQGITVIPSPSGDFVHSWLGSTVWVSGKDANANYVWDFGDGSKAVGRYATHTYAGRETLKNSVITMTATGLNGCTSSAFIQADAPKVLYYPIVTP